MHYFAWELELLIKYTGQSHTSFLKKGLVFFSLLIKEPKIRQSRDYIIWKCDGLQIATVEVPEEHMGPVVELLGKRRGQMFDMQGVGCV